jgi:hypothetical protein
MIYFCKFCNRPMENVKSFVEFKSNQFCTKCFEERVEAIKLEGLEDDDTKLYSIDANGMNDDDFESIIRKLFEIDDEDEDDQ